jgi:hypothetical protein
LMPEFRRRSCTARRSTSGSNSRWRADGNSTTRGIRSTGAPKFLFFRKSGPTSVGGHVLALTRGNLRPSCGRYSTPGMTVSSGRSDSRNLAQEFVATPNQRQEPRCGTGVLVAKSSAREVLRLRPVRAISGPSPIPDRPRCSTSALGAGPEPTTQCAAPQSAVIHPSQQQQKTGDHDCRRASLKYRPDPETHDVGMAEKSQDHGGDAKQDACNARHTTAQCQQVFHGRSPSRRPRVLRCNEAFALNDSAKFGCACRARYR